MISAAWTEEGTFAVLTAQLVVLAVAAFVAWRQVREARQLREAQVQPFVVVDFEFDEPRRNEVRLVISNIGRTMARDVRLKFTPELTSSLDSDAGIVAPRDLKPLRDGIPSLPPRKRVVVMLDLFTHRDAAVFPDEYQVSISYYAPALKRSLSDESVLDLGIYRNILHSDRRDVHDVHERLKELVNEARKWTAGGRGIEVLTPQAQRARTRMNLDYHRAAQVGRVRGAFYRARIICLRWLV